MDYEDKQDLVVLIDRLVQEKTFSADGAIAMAKLREQVVQLTQSLKDSQTSYKVACDDREKLYDKIDKLENEKVKHEKRVADLQARELAVSGIEKDKAVAEAKFEVMQSNMAMIFKPLQIRRSIFENLTPDTAYTGTGGSHPSKVVRNLEETSEE